MYMKTFKKYIMIFIYHRTILLTNIVEIIVQEVENRVN